MKKDLKELKKELKAANSLLMDCQIALDWWTYERKHQNIDYDLQCAIDYTKAHALMELSKWSKK